MVFKSLQLFRILMYRFASGANPSLSISQPTMGNGCNKRGFGALGWVEAFGVQPDLDEYILNGIFDLGLCMIEVAPAQSPNETAVGANTIIRCGFITIRDALKNADQAVSL